MRKIFHLNNGHYVEVDDEEVQEGDYFLYKNEEIRFKSSSKLVEHGGHTCHQSGIQLYEVQYCKRIIRSTDSDLYPMEDMPFPDDVIDSRGEDDGLLSFAMELAKLFSEEMVSLYPIFHPDLPQDEMDRMRTIIKSCSHIGFRRGYLQGYADAKKSEDEQTQD